MAVRRKKSIKCLVCFDVGECAYIWLDPPDRAWPCHKCSNGPTVSELCEFFHFRPIYTINGELEAFVRTTPKGKVKLDLPKREYSTRYGKVKV